MLSRKFTKREKVLLLILALLLVGELYYLLVHRRVENDLMEAQSRLEEATVSYNIESARTAKKNGMLKAIQEAQKNEGVHPLPDYDNSTNVVAYLNGVMASTDEYNLIFDAVSFSNYVAMRPINMNFTCQGYPAVRNIVTQLENGPYYCEVTGLSMSAGNGIDDLTGGNMSVQMTAVFYEYVGTEQNQEDGAVGNGSEGDGAP